MEKNFENLGFHKITENALEVIRKKAENNKEKKFIIPKYDEIIIPVRKTIYSAGYDLPIPVDLTLQPDELVYLCLGIEIRMPLIALMQLSSRSSNNTPIKLNNYVSIVDADYCNSRDEETGEYIGAIYLPLKNFGKETVTIPRGTSIIQGVILNFQTYDSIPPTEIRNGGFGSTGK